MKKPKRANTQTKSACFMGFMNSGRGSSEEAKLSNRMGNTRSKSGTPKNAQANPDLAERARADLNAKLKQRTKSTRRQTDHSQKVNKQANSIAKLESPIS